MSESSFVVCEARHALQAQQIIRNGTSPPHYSVMMAYLGKIYLHMPSKSIFGCLGFHSTLLQAFLKFKAFDTSDVDLAGDNGRTQVDVGWTPSVTQCPVDLLITTHRSRM